MSTEEKSSQAPFSDLPFSDISEPVEPSHTVDIVSEDRRFPITPESARIFKSIREELPELQDRKPWVQGVGFYGSRIRGQERPDSDVDIIVYGTPNSSFLKHVSEEDVQQLVKSSGAHVDLHPFVPEYGEFAQVRYFVDISPQALRRDIASFREHINDTSSSLISPEGDLPKLFYLAVGAGVYKARQYVLDQLAGLSGHEGDAIMELIAEELNKHERTDSRTYKPDNPLYAHFPKTVTEARAYFINKEYTASEYPGLSEKEYEDARRKEWQEAAKERELERKAKTRGIRRFIGKLTARG